MIIYYDNPFNWRNLDNQESRAKKLNKLPTNTDSSQA